MKRRTRSVIVAASLGVGMALVSSHAQAFYAQTNLVSDLPGVAAVTDTNLVNPWGMSAGPGGPIWVSDNGAGVSTLYTGTGQPFPTASPLVVSIPNGAPTGQVFTGNVAAFTGVRFVFASESGTISAWTSGTSAVAQFTSASAVLRRYATLRHGLP